MGKKVMHLLTGTSFSGAENVACQIMSCFQGDADYEMFYCSPDGKIRDALTERNIRFVLMKEWSLLDVKRVLREEKPDIIHAHDMKASFYAALVCGKTPLVSHIHNNNFDSRGISIKALLYKFAGMKARHIFWVSKSAYEGYAFHDKFTGKSSILYNVIDIAAVYQKALEDTKEYIYDIVYVGRLTFQKNPQRLVEVLTGVQKRYPTLKAAIVGDGDLEMQTKQVIEELHVEKCIDMLGYSSNPYKIIKNAKILIMTSRWEGLPMCALEAMALGVPIVSTPTDGLKEIVEDDKTGYLSDDDEILINRCYDILHEPERYQRLSRATLAKAKVLLNVAAYKEELEKVYSSI